MRRISQHQKDRIVQRRKREGQNPFSRLPSTYAASRLQGQRLLRAAGGLSIVEWRVLWDLVEAGPMTIGEMAEIQRVDPSQLSRALPGMRKKGFVVAGHRNTDGRQVTVEVAPAGKRAFEKAEPIMRRRRETLKDVFSEEELADFIDMLDRFEALCRSSIDPILELDPKT